MSDIHHFLVVDNLFERYTIVVRLTSRETSVYCKDCEEWVAEWPGEQLTTHSSVELFEKIISEHEHDFPERVEFSNETVSFK